MCESCDLLPATTTVEVDGAPVPVCGECNDLVTVTRRYLAKRDSTPQPACPRTGLPVHQCDCFDRVPAQLIRY